VQPEVLEGRPNAGSAGVSQTSSPAMAQLEPLAHSPSVECARCILVGMVERKEVAHFVLDGLGAVGRIRCFNQHPLWPAREIGQAAHPRSPILGVEGIEEVHVERVGHVVCAANHCIFCRKWIACPADRQVKVGVAVDRFDGATLKKLDVGRAECAVEVADHSSGKPSYSIRPCRWCG
jgi:hypothetical protein